MRRFLFLLSLLWISVVMGSPMVFRENAIPEMEVVKELYLPVYFQPPADCCASGTLALWVHPDDWSAEDKGFYNIVIAGDRNASSPGFEFTRNQDGVLRILWFNHFAEKEAGDILVSNPEIAVGRWNHFAITWERNQNGSSNVELWLNGKLAGKRWNAFSWTQEEFNGIWHLNDSPAWARALTEKRMALGKVALYSRKLNADEVASLARECYLQGENAYVDRDFLPNTENLLMGRLCTPVQNVCLDVDQADELGRAPLPLRRVPLPLHESIPLTVDAEGNFQTTVKIWDDTHETRFTLRDEAGGFPLWRLIHVEYDPALPKFRKNYWQASWIATATKPPKGHFDGGTWYFVKEFEIDLSQVAKAACQYVGSNNGNAYINGHSLGRTYGWATPKAVDDVLPFLRDGKNVFGGDAQIPHDSSTFMGELTLLMKDGSVRYIGTGTDWQYSDVKVEGWDLPEFDHSSWGHAVAFTRPPQLPYGETAYTNFVPVPEIVPEGLPCNLTVKAGEHASFFWKCTVPPESPSLEDAEVWLLLILNGREFYRTPVKVFGGKGMLHLVGPVFYVPVAASSHVFDLRLESRSIKFPDTIGTLTIEEKDLSSSWPVMAVRFINDVPVLHLNDMPIPELPSPPRLFGSRLVNGVSVPLVNGTPISELYPSLSTVTEVRSINGVPVLHLNGKPIPALLQRSAINVRHNTSCYRFTTGLDRSGVRLEEMNLEFERLWREDGSLDTEELDLNVESALFYAPSSQLVLFFNTDAPEWYVKAHPEQGFVSNQGPNGKITYASQQWRKDSTEFLGRILDHLVKQPYYHRISGIGLDGGDDGQFMQWAGRGITYVGDYSAPMRDYYHDHLRKTYGDIATLNAQWGTNHADFNTIEIPSVERRQGTEEKAFLDPRADADIVEFNRAFSACVADIITDYAALIKKKTERTRIVAAYYGKFFSIAGILQWGEFDIERILACPDLDYLIAVDYKERGRGHPHEHSAPLASYRYHNKIFVDEADIRSYISGRSAWAQAKTLFDFASVARKMFIKSWVGGHGLHWYDLHGGMFENQGLWRTIGIIQRIAEKNPTRTVPKAEIALIADEKSFLYTTYTRRQLGAVRQNSSFGRIGAPYDVWFLNDLCAEDFPEYKMYVFLNAWAPTEEQRQAINALKRDGKLLVFLHNSGYIRGQTRSVENVSDLTGVQMAESGPVELTMRFSPGDGGELFQKVNKEIYSTAGKAENAAVPVDEKAMLCGAFLRTGQWKPMAFKSMDGWDCFYSAVTLLPLELWRELARHAGVHLYTEDPDAMLYIGSDLLGIHSGAGGDKQLSFPSKHTFVDAITDDVVAEETNSPVIPMKPGETRIFRLK